VARVVTGKASPVSSIQLGALADPRLILDCKYPYKLISKTSAIHVIPRYKVLDASKAVSCNYSIP
jgi:hypothetical protein